MKSRYFILRLRELLVLTNLLLCLKVRVAFMKQLLVQSSTGNCTELPSRRNCHYQWGLLTSMLYTSYSHLSCIFASVVNWFFGNASSQSRHQFLQLVIRAQPRNLNNQWRTRVGLKTAVFIADELVEHCLTSHNRKHNWSELLGTDCLFPHGKTPWPALGRTGLTSWQMIILELWT